MNEGSGNHTCTCGLVKLGAWEKISEGHNDGVQASVQLPYWKRRLIDPT